MAFLGHVTASLPERLQDLSGQDALPRPLALRRSATPSDPRVSHLPGMGVSNGPERASHLLRNGCLICSGIRTCARSSGSSSVITSMNGRTGRWPSRRRSRGPSCRREGLFRDRFSGDSTTPMPERRELGYHFAALQPPALSWQVSNQFAFEQVLQGGGHLIQCDLFVAEAARVLRPRDPIGQSAWPNPEP